MGYNVLGLLILSGGRGSRIGKKKALVKLCDKPLILHVVERLRGFAREMVVVIGKDDEPDEYRRILPSRVKIRKDTVARGGPLAGVLAGMLELCSEYAAVLPCDSPFVRKDVFKFLFHKTRGNDAAIPQWPNGYIEPLHAVYRVSSCLPAAENALESGKLSIRDMIAGLSKVVYVGTNELRRFDPELSTFFNINNWKDLRVAAKILKTLSV